jgi:hypothetical protein
MKKAKLNGKLSLKKETLANLQPEQLRQIEGGDFQPTSTVRPTYYICTRTRLINCFHSLPFCPTETCPG